VAIETIVVYRHNRYPTPDDFAYSVSRDCMRSGQTPMLIMPDDMPARPYAVCIEVAELAPEA
jgi:hypothetical protein